MGFCECGKFTSSIKNNTASNEIRCIEKGECCSNEKQKTSSHPLKGSRDGNCNQKNLVNFYKVDKLCVEAPTGIDHIFFTAFISSFYNTACLKKSDVDISIVKHCLLNYHPPIPDIRIAIHSFQI